MTKIKLLRDIPGYKAGDEIDGSDSAVWPQVYTVAFGLDWLIKHGWAVSLPDTVDVEKVRSRIRFESLSTQTGSPHGHVLLDDSVSVTDLRWFTDYRRVSEVIRLLNDGWEADWGDDLQRKYNFHYDYDEKIFDWEANDTVKVSILPYCKSEEVAKEVIRLVEDELKVLFGVTK